MVGGAGDCAAGAVGNGIVNRGALSTSIGTSGVMFVHSDEVQVDPQGRLHTFCHAVRGKWHLMGVNLSGGGCLQWFRNQLCQAEMAAAKRAKRRSLRNADRRGRADAARQRRAVLPALSVGRAHAARRPRRPRLLCRPDAGPHPRPPGARDHGGGDLSPCATAWRSFASWACRSEQIRASGGGSRSPLWRQIQADVFGQKVVTINAEEGPAYGVALLAAVGAGAFKNIEEACGATMRVTRQTAPRRAAVARYDAAFPEYQQLYRSLKDDFQRIAALVHGK